MFKDLVAIDLSSNELKIARMIFSHPRKEVANLLNQNIRDLSEEDIAKAIKQTLKQMNIAKPRVISAIPSFLAITKNIEIPSRNPGEIKEIINLQAARHTPYSRDEIIIDYIIIGSHKQSYTKVLLVIVTRSVIRKQFEILSKAGLSVERFAFAPEAICHIFSKTLRLANLDAPVSIIHIDEGYTDFMLTLRDRVIFIRSIPIGTQHLLTEKEKYLPKFVDEVKKSLEAYTNEDIERHPNRLILTGAIEMAGDLINALNDTLGIPTEGLAYLTHLSISEKALKAASLVSHLSFLNVVAPLFTYDELKLDLIPEEIKLERALQQRAREIIKAGILLMATFVLIYCILISHIFIKSAYLRKLDSRYKSMHKEAEELEGDFIRIQIIRDYLSGRGYSVEVLSEIYNALPLDIQTNNLKFDVEGSFSIEGTAESMATVFTFVDNLGKSRYFQNVETRYTKKRKEGEKDFTDFAVSCALNKKIR